HGQAYYQAQLRRDDQTLPQGMSSDVRGQYASLGKLQARIDSLNSVRAAVQSGDASAIGATVERHNKLFPDEQLPDNPTVNEIVDRAIVRQSDASQLKRYWTANQNGPHEAIGHIFDQYHQLQQTDRAGASKWLEDHRQELADLGYKLGPARN